MTINSTLCTETTYRAHCSDHQSTTHKLTIPAEESALFYLPKSVYQLELEIFRMREMARFWIEENAISPYKLALQANVSTSQTHRVLSDDWSPTAKLLTKIASSLPSDWTDEFEQDCNFVLPDCIELPDSSNIVVDVKELKKIYQTSEDIESFLYNLRKRRFSYFIFEPLPSRIELSQLFISDLGLYDYLPQQHKGFPFFNPQLRISQSKKSNATKLHRHPVTNRSGSHVLIYWSVKHEINNVNINIFNIIDILSFNSNRQEKILSRFEAYFSKLPYPS